MRSRLSHDLRSAVRARDLVAVSALRSAMAAIDNATAVPEVANDQRTTVTSAHVAGTTVGLGAADVERRELSDAEARGLLKAQVDERLAAADEYLRLGRHDRANQYRAEADVLRQYLRATER